MQLDVAAGKTAKKRAGRGGVTSGGKGVAARTVGMLGTILEFAKRRRLITTNPARGVQKLREGKQRRFLNIEEIESLVKKGGEVGKRLDFLIQELHREANTLGSKSAALELTRISVDMKVLIEQMREQVQNLE